MIFIKQSSTTTKGGGLIYADVTLGNPWQGGSRRKQNGIYALTNHPAPLPEAGNESAQTPSGAV